MQHQLNRHVQQGDSKELSEGLKLTSNTPKKDFYQLFANTLYEQSNKVLLTQKEKSASTIEKNRLLLEQLNYRNGIHYSVPNHFT